MNTSTAKKCRRLRRREASEYLKEEWGILRKPSTLAKLASVGGEPVIEYDGTIPLYREEALEGARHLFRACCTPEDFVNREKA